MMILFKLILLTYICVMGLKIVMSEGMLLERLGTWMEIMVEEKGKAFMLFVCPWCMATLQSVTAHAFAFGLGILPLEFHWSLLVRWPLVIMGASFLSGNTWNLYETINAIKARNEAETEYFRKEETDLQTFSPSHFSHFEDFDSMDIKNMQ